MIIVIEGIDGAGTSTQSKRLFEYLKSKGINVKLKSYPDKESYLGRLIYKMLKEGFNVDVDTKFLLYATDIQKDKKFLSENRVIILDRYFTSTIAYQSVDGFPIKKALEFAEMFSIPVPDLVIYIDIPVEVGINRMIKSGKILDVHESNKEFLEKVRNRYLELEKKNVFGKWVKINGDKPVDEVTQDIIDIVGEFLDID